MAVSQRRGPAQELLGLQGWDISNPDLAAKTRVFLKGHSSLVQRSLEKLVLMPVERINQLSGKREGREGREAFRPSRPPYPSYFPPIKGNWANSPAVAPCQ